jgi:large subunit ribosomal protein L9
MKVIIIKTGEVKEVSVGFARNYLFPNKLAMVASENALKQAEEKRKRLSAEAEAKKKAEEVLFNQVKNQSVKIQVKTNDEGKLFAALSEKEVVASLAEQKKIQVPESWVKISKNIKEIGDHSIDIETDAGLKSKLQVQLVK